MDGVLTLGVDASWIGTNRLVSFSVTQKAPRAQLFIHVVTREKEKKESIRLKAAVQKNKAFTFTNEQLCSSEPSRTGPGGGGSDVSVCSIQNNSLISVRLHQNQNQKPRSGPQPAVRERLSENFVPACPGSVLLHIVC